MSSVTNNPKRSQNINIVIVGDVVGKTCLLEYYTTGKFPDHTEMTVFNEYKKQVIVDDKEYSVTLSDTSGSDLHTQLRGLQYPNTDCCIITYAIDYKTSFENVRPGWVAEISEHCPNVPFVLVGTKLDRRSSVQSTDNHVPFAEALKLSKKIGAKAVFECSAKTGENVDTVFNSVMQIILQKPTQKKCVCF